MINEAYKLFCTESISLLKRNKIRIKKQVVVVDVTEHNELKTHVLRLFRERLKHMKLQRLLTSLSNTTHPLLKQDPRLQDTHTHTDSFKSICAHTHTHSHTYIQTDRCSTEFLPCRAVYHWSQTALCRGTQKKTVKLLLLDISLRWTNQWCQIKSNRQETVGWRPKSDKKHSNMKIPWLSLTCSLSLQTSRPILCALRLRLTYRLLWVKGHFVDRASMAWQLVEDPAWCGVPDIHKSIKTEK